MTEDDRSVWSQLSAPARYQKKVWTDPRFRHAGSIGKFVPCFEEDGEPTLQDRIDVLLQPVAAGVRGDHRDCVDALVERSWTSSPKQKKRDSHPPGVLPEERRQVTRISLTSGADRSLRKGSRRTWRSSAVRVSSWTRTRTARSLYVDFVSRCIRICRLGDANRLVEFGAE